MLVGAFACTKAILDGVKPDLGFGRRLIQRDKSVVGSDGEFAQGNETGWNVLRVEGLALAFIPLASNVHGESVGQKGLRKVDRHHFPR